MPARHKPQPSSVQSVAFVALGCPKNLVDSEKMLGLLAEDGLVITPDATEADAIVINTCGFLEASKDESLGEIRQAIADKLQAQRQGRTMRVIVAGCLVQRHREELLKEVPEVDALVGVFDRENIVKAVRGHFEPLPDTGKDMGKFHTVSQFISKPDRKRVGYTESDRARLRLTPRHMAYLRISEGCNQGCTFCTIPSIRGKMRSKPIADILSEAQELIADGVLELNLIGQDTTSYGSDIGYSAGLPGLIRELDKVPGAVWIRLMYAYPSCFTDEMISALAQSQHFVKYIDMPLQHINDGILQAMRRKVTRQAIETLLGKLRKAMPNIALRTTMISGFPGETDAQHQELLEFIQAFEFDCLGVFEYSPEPGTPAGRLWETQKVAPELSAARKEELMLAQQQIVFKKNKAMVGQTIQVLVDELQSRPKLAIARFAGQAPEYDTHILIPKATLVPGDMLDVRITQWQDYDLVAEVLGSPKAATKRKKPLSLPVLK